MYFFASIVTGFLKNVLASVCSNILPLLKRMVEPEDIAQGILFLAVNPAITGQTVVLDNGRLPT